MSRPVRFMGSFHGFVPGTNGSSARNPAHLAELLAAAGRRLPRSGSKRHLLPAHGLVRPLTQPPSPHRLLAHLLTQAHQLLPLLLAPPAGIAGALLLHCLLRARARRRLARSLTALELRPGREPVEPAALERALAALHGLLPAWPRRLLGHTPWLLLELQRTQEEGLAVRLLLPRAALPLATAALRAGLPGCQLHPADPPPLHIEARAARGRLGQRAGQLLPLAADPQPVLPALLGALEAEQGEAVLQLTLQPASSRWLGRLYSAAHRHQHGPPRRPLAARLADLPLTLSEQALACLSELVQPGPSEPRRSSQVGVAGPASLLEAERAQALRARARSGSVAFCCGIRFACHADHPARSKAWAQALQAQLRPLDGPHNGLAPKRVWPWQRARFDRSLRGRQPETGMLLTAAELVPLFDPSGSDRLAELAQAGARQVPPPLDPISTVGFEEGRPFALATFPGREHEVRLSRTAARTHLHLIGPPGSGKTSTLLRLALGSAEVDGTGIWEAKGDLARAFLLALPPAGYERLCLVDLADTDLVVGINPLEAHTEEERERVADDTLSIFKRRFHRFWGPQTDDLFKGALRTLLLVPGSTLLELPLLLTDPGFRAKYLHEVSDPIALGPFWQRYEQLSPQAQAQAIGPVLNKLRDFLFRSRLRAMLGQAESTISFEQALTRRLIMIMNLPKGAGREQAEVVGAFSLAKLWQAALARADLPERERTDFHCYLDEFQNFLHAEDFAEILAEARALRLSLCLAHQTLAQLSERETALLLNLVRNLVCFQPGHEDAGRLARALAPSFTPDDLHRLGPYEIAVRLSKDGATQHPFSARTLPPPLFDVTPWIAHCRQQLATAATNTAAPPDLHAAAADAWPKLETGDRQALLSQLQPLLSQPRPPLNERVELLLALPEESYGHYQQLSATLRQLERAHLLALSRDEILQRILATAAGRHADPQAEQAKQRRHLSALDDEQWASAVEQERLERLQRLSGLRYGRPLDEIEVAIRRRLGASIATAAADGVERAAA
jgi:TraM recognition site of TraD and TraG